MTDTAAGSIDILSLGTLHDAVFAFSRQTSLEEFWDSVALNTRWVVPARRVCVLRHHSDSTVTIAARVASGRTLEPIESPISVGADPLGEALSTVRPMWLEDLASLDSDELREWLKDNPSGVIHTVPMVGAARKLGVLVLDLPDPPTSADRARVTALASLYTRHAVSAHGVIRTTSELARQNEELAATQRQLLDAADRIQELNFSLEHRIEERTRQLEVAQEELMRVNESLKHLALHDDLTGLANRTLFNDRVEHLLQQADRVGESFAILLMDGDGFKQINDTYGHHVGDIVLRAIGDRAEGVLRDHDTVARLGGDEFAVILDRVGPSEARKVAEKIVRAVEEPLPVDDRGTTVTPRISVGIAAHPHHGGGLDQLLRRADEAMYRAKDSDRQCVVYGGDPVDT